MSGPQPGDLVLPGDAILQLTAESNIRLGNGLLQDGDRVIATKAGRLSSHKKKTGALTLWVENAQRRYIPSVDDLVIGTVIDKLGESYKVDLGGALPAVLSALAFEGATRKNRPALIVGSLVYARVAVANKDMETELVCTAKQGSSAIDSLGELSGGYAFKCDSMALSRSLLNGTNPVLVALGKKIPYEIAVGFNGRAWVTSQSSVNTVLVSNAIQNSALVPRARIDDLVQEMLLRASAE